MPESSSYPNPPGWRPPPRQGTPVWVWLLAGCGGLMLLAAVGVVMVVVNVGKTVTKVINEAKVEVESANRNLKVVDQKLTLFQGKRYVVGTLKNVSPTDTYENADVTFTLFDKHGRILDETASAETESPLKPGGTWRFKAEVEDAQATSCKLSNVSGFRTGAKERMFGLDEKSGVSPARK